MGSRVCGLQELWHRGLVAPRHVGSSWTRDQTHVPCIGRWILHHWATREALVNLFKNCVAIQYTFIICLTRLLLSCIEAVANFVPLWKKYASIKSSCLLLVPFVQMDLQDKFLRTEQKKAQCNWSILNFLYTIIMETFNQLVENTSQEP